MELEKLWWWQDPTAVVPLALAGEEAVAAVPMGEEALGIGY